MRSCVAQVDLEIYEDAWDDIAYDWKKVKTITTDDDGDFSGFVRPKHSANYRVQLQSPSPCGEATSKTRTARVQMTVQLRVEAVGKRDRLQFEASVSPACPQRAHKGSNLGNFLALCFVQGSTTREGKAAERDPEEGRSRRNFRRGPRCIPRTRLPQDAVKDKPVVSVLVHRDRSTCDRKSLGACILRASAAAGESESVKLPRSS